MSFCNKLAGKHKKKMYNDKLIKFETLQIVITDLRGNRIERKAKQPFSAHAHLNGKRELRVFHLPERSVFPEVQRKS